MITKDKLKVSYQHTFISWFRKCCYSATIQLDPTTDTPKFFCSIFHFYFSSLSYGYTYDIYTSHTTFPYRTVQYLSSRRFKRVKQSFETPKKLKKLIAKKAPNLRKKKIHRDPNLMI